MFKAIATFTFLSMRRGISKTEQPFITVWLLADDGTPVQFFLHKSAPFDEMGKKFEMFSSGDVVSVTFYGQAFSQGVRLSICDIDYV